jgi:hypothetical protein
MKRMIPSFSTFISKKNVEKIHSLTDVENMWNGAFYRGLYGIMLIE